MPITESGLPLDVDNRFLAKQLFDLTAKVVETQRICREQTDRMERMVRDANAGWSNVVHRVGALESEVGEIRAHLALPPAPPPNWATRSWPLVRLAALVALTLAFVFALVVGAVVLMHRS